MEKQPLKRSKYIVQLSRDHHFGLLFCWKIRQGIKNGIDLSRIRSYINYFWKQHLEQHFGEEENLLLNKIDKAIAGQVINEHQVIRLLISGINGYGKNDVDLYKQLVSLVEQHIRYEERVLFPYVEKHLTEEQLQEVSSVLVANHAMPSQENFDDEFWLRERVCQH